MFALLTALFVLTGAVIYVSRKEDPEPYDLASTRACLEATARVETIAGGDGVFTYPGLSVAFPGEHRPDYPLELYFAPTTREAEAAEVPDSDRVQRRRNVLTNWVATAPWDPRVAACLRAGAEREGERR